MTELFNELKEYRNENILKAAAYFHANFENMHPFADGNGRVGRTLLNYFLMINNHPPIIIYEEDRKDYYNALQSFDEALDIQALTTFLEKQCIKTWANNIL